MGTYIGNHSTPSSASGMTTYLRYNLVNNVIMCVSGIPFSPSMASSWERIETRQFSDLYKPLNC